MSAFRFFFRASTLGAVALVLLMGSRSGLARAPEPANLFPLKQEIRAYVDSGDYQEKIAAVAAEAKAWIEDRTRLQLRAPGATTAGPERLAVVLDLDETLISNLPTLLKQDFGYVPDVWAAWVRQAEAPAIEPVKEIFETARRLHIAVILLSGRQESDRVATEKNLKTIGCGDYVRLLLQPDDSRVTTGIFKRDERRRLLAEGYVIIANVGDQESDFLEGAAERYFKLPNPFYLTP